MQEKEYSPERIISDSLRFWDELPLDPSVVVFEKVREAREARLDQVADGLKSYEPDITEQELSEVLREFKRPNRQMANQDRETLLQIGKQELIEQGETHYKTRFEAISLHEPEKCSDCSEEVSNDRASRVVSLESGNSVEIEDYTTQKNNLFLITQASDHHLRQHPTSTLAQSAAADLEALRRAIQ